MIKKIIFSLLKFWPIYGKFWDVNDDRFDLFWTLLYSIWEKLQEHIWKKLGAIIFSVQSRGGFWLREPHQTQVWQYIYYRFKKNNYWIIFLSQSSYFEVVLMIKQIIKWNNNVCLALTFVLLMGNIM